MAKVIVMPKLGYTQDSGAIAAWLKNEGDTVERAVSYTHLTLPTNREV